MTRTRGWRMKNTREGERGAVAVMFTLMLVVVTGFAVLLVDLGQVRTSSRNELMQADFAALAAAKRLGIGDAKGGCVDAITYINANVSRLTSPIDANNFCTPISNVCDNTSTSQAPAIQQGDVQVSIHYPVPASEIQSQYWTGAGKNDGPSQCQRMRVIVSTRDAAMFAGVLGKSSSWSSRSATVRPSAATGSPPALWLLDPVGCVALKVDGGSQVTVGTNTVQGVITVDSDGTGGTCNGSTSTISSTGSGSFLKAIGPPSGGTTGLINLNALPWGQTTCIFPACDSADVAGSRLMPQPQHGDSASRAIVDWQFNCKSSYPNYHGETVYGCQDTVSNGGNSYPYLDNLKTAIGTSGSPATGTWTQIGPGNSECSPSASVVYPYGNYWVRCTRGNNGFRVNSGVTITFEGGNVVFEDNVTVSNGGTINFNTGTRTPTTLEQTRGRSIANLPSNCVPPKYGGTYSSACIDKSSPLAAFVYIRGATDTSFSTSGTGTINLKDTFVYGGTGSVGFTGSPPRWTSPEEGPFKYLAYWSDMPATASNGERTSFTITGGSGAELTGLFFTPEASPFKLAGGGNWGQQRAQFVSYQLTVTGGGVLSMQPDPGLPFPPVVRGYLIR